LRIGDWHIDPIAGQISRNDEKVRVDARTLKLLLVLAQRPGETISIDELLERAWEGVVVTPDSVYQGIATLRRLLGDNPKQTRYIVTVPRLGYRLIAPVVVTSDEPKTTSGVSNVVHPDASGGREPLARHRHWAITMAGIVTAIALVAGLIFLRASNFPTAPGYAPRPNVGVAPFVDLTPSMDQDQLADEMTEGVADRLSRNSALQTPGFRASYYLIGKPTTVKEAGRKLAVTYVVDGSVRRSAQTVRITARLVRADSGVVLWSQVFEQPVMKLNVVQDDIVSSVAAALTKVGSATG